MKHLKSTLFSLIALFVGATMLVSCSEDNETTTNKTTNIDSFLKSFYSKDYSLGTSAKVNPNSQLSSLARTATIEEMEVTEVFVSNETEARGYIITDKNTGEFLYFIDVDRDAYILISLDVKNSEQKTFNNIDEIYNYFSTDEFDFIEIALDDNSNTDVAGRRFWGSQYNQGPCGEAGEGMAYVYQDYYVFGIRVKHELQTSLTDSSQPLVEPCGFR
ncbi:hypothetical protein [Flavobacterium sp.]|jgi:hypothetical protein|uniref:hypothetical protein n=1 Tax=Flavobacterium sp. TaxID=239 RepID=UPI003509EA48